MGQKLVKYYEAIKSEGGFAAQMRLAMKTCIASTKAAELPDSPENLLKFKTAYKEITGKEALIN
jgi:hypothetical protein